MKYTVIAIYSGGLDSTVMLAHLLDQGHNVMALSFNYGQRHNRELKAAAAICEVLGIPHEVADLTGIRHLLKGSSQTDDSVPVPHGHYAEENMKKTVVPNRNMIMLSVAAGWAMSLKAKAVAYAAHAGDHAIYPDCRESFVKPLGEAIKQADWHEVELWRPFLKMTKAQIAGHGADLGHATIMAASYSCYEGGAEHCGLCGTCQERRVAFRDALIPDLTVYNEAALQQLPTAQLTA